MRVVTPLLILVSFLFIPIHQAQTKSAGAPAARTGAPQNGTCAISGCHDQAQPNAGAGSISISVPSNFMPGDTVEFVVRVTETGASTFGFQATVRHDDSLRVAGKLLLDQGLKFSDAIGDYITHATDVQGADEIEWTVRWVAPEADVEDIIIFAAGVAGNNDNNRGGDKVYTAAVTLPVHVTTESEQPTKAFSVQPAYPNPAIRQAVIGYELTLPEPIRIALYDALGRLVKDISTPSQAPGVHEVRVDTDDLPAGLYFYELKTPTQQEVRSLTVIR